MHLVLCQTVAFDWIPRQVERWPVGFRAAIHLGMWYRWHLYRRIRKWLKYDMCTYYCLSSSTLPYPHVYGLITSLEIPQDHLALPTATWTSKLGWPLEGIHEEILETWKAGATRVCEPKERGVEEVRGSSEAPFQKWVLGIYLADYYVIEGRVWGSRAVEERAVACGWSR